MVHGFLTLNEPSCLRGKCMLLWSLGLALTTSFSSVFYVLRYFRVVWYLLTYSMLVGRGSDKYIE